MYFGIFTLFYEFKAPSHNYWESLAVARHYASIDFVTGLLGTGLLGTCAEHLFFDGDIKKGLFDWDRDLPKDLSIPTARKIQKYAGDDKIFWNWASEEDLLDIFHYFPAGKRIFTYDEWADTIVTIKNIPLDFFCKLSPEGREGYPEKVRVIYHVSLF